LTLEDCKKMTAACEATAKQNGWRVTIAILDDGGHVLLVTRMDGAPPLTAEIAIQKARSAAIARSSTKLSEDRIAAGRIVLLKMPVLPVQGGMPIMYQGHCVGAVGVSGAHSGTTSEGDERVCNAGIGALA
jgi:uncharacterized protein GlcG (DUF336 family)